MDNNQLIEHISKMSVLELSNLVKQLEEKFGVSAAAAVAAAPAAAAAAPAEAEKTEFDVVLTAAGENKLNVIKEIRLIIPTLGLKEAKDLVESAGDACKVKEGVNKKDAEDMKKRLEAAGAKVAIK